MSNSNNPTKRRAKSRSASAEGRRSRGWLITIPVLATEPDDPDDPARGRHPTGGIRYERDIAAAFADWPWCGQIEEGTQREDALAHLAFHREHWIRLRTNNVQERANAEIKRRTRAVQIFPSRESLIRLVGAVLVDMNETWTRHRFMSADDMATALEPRAREHVEISDETRQRADQIIRTALESAA